MIDIRKLKELVRLMVENDLSELDLRDQEEKVTIKRGAEAPEIIHAPAVMAAPAASAPAAAPAPAPAASDGDGGSAVPDGLVAIESPMVGTYYSAANPDSPPFAEVGASVGPDTTVCLIEAMKVFNEIKAEVSGTVERILVENGTAVEFGQQIMLVRPA